LPNHAIPDLLMRAAKFADYCAINAAAIDYIGAFPVQEFEMIRDLRLLAAPLRRELGGLGLGIDSSATYDLLLLLKHLGRGNLAVGRIYEGHVNALQLVQTFGTVEQIEMYACDARDRHLLFGVWSAEGAEGVKVALTEQGCRLEGAKTFCSGSGYVKRPFVGGALPNGEWQMCIVPIDEVDTVSDPGWWQPSGMRATASYKIDFTNVELGQSAMIGEPKEYLQQPWLTAGVIRFAAVQLGGAEALLDETRTYLQSLGRRDQGFQQARVAKMAIAIESGHLWLQSAAKFLSAYAPQFAGVPGEQTPEQIEQLVAYSNMVRTAIEQICMDVMQLCERCVGARGLLPPNAMERIIRDLTLYLRQPAYDGALTQPGGYALSQVRPSDLLWVPVNESA
jgi:alkylation response protein AidB-like acyl-CoA dehydrogenase